jgi:hypothetical protein
MVPGQAQSGLAGGHPAADSSSAGCGNARRVFMGYYNWRGTGNALLPPYVLNDRTYFTSPFFIGENPKPALHYSNPQLDNFYNAYSQQYWLLNRVNSLRTAIRHFLVMGLKLIYFFMWPELCVVFLAIPWIVRDHRTRFLALTAAVSLSGSYLVIWFLPHYAAPLTAVLLPRAQTYPSSNIEREFQHSLRICPGSS